MNTVWCDLPICKCPHCGNQFQWQDYYDLKAGSTTECPVCEKTIHVLCMDHTINVELSTEAGDD